MRLLLVASDSKLRRIVSLGAAGAEPDVVMATRGSELLGIADLASFDAAVVDWQLYPESAAAIASMLRVIDHLTASDSGRFLTHNGETIPW